MVRPLADGRGQGLNRHRPPIVLRAAALLALAYGLVSLTLAGLMLVFVLTVHLPGMGNEASAQMSTISLLKDLLIAGGALAFVSRRPLVTA